MSPEMKHTKNPLEQLIDQINIAANRGLEQVAIGMAVALPAICASLEMENGRSQGKEYISWCQANLIGDGFTFVTAEQIYSIRCGVLHGGRGDITNKKGQSQNADGEISRVIFLPPGGFSMTNCRMNDAYAYGVVEFCRNMGQAALRWYEKNKDDKFVSANIGLMMTYHPNGLAPYTSGVPVLA